MARKAILRKETVPIVETVLGKVSASYNPGGNYNSSFSSSDVNNFDVKDDGEIIVRDPERSLLTTTLYPLTFTESFQTTPSSKQVEGVLTDNLYANTGLRELFKSSIISVEIPVFKRTLQVYHYYENFLKKYDAFKVYPKNIELVLRNVLKEITGGSETVNLQKDLNINNTKFYINGEQVFPTRVGDEFKLVLTPEQQVNAEEFGITVVVTTTPHNPLDPAAELNGSESYTITAKTEQQITAATSTGVIVKPNTAIPPPANPGNPYDASFPTSTISGGSGKEGDLLTHTVIISKTKTDSTDLTITIGFIGATGDASNRIKTEKFKVFPKKITGTFRSVLLEWSKWKNEKIIVTGKTVLIPVSTLYTSKFKTLLLGDSENVQTVVSDRVVQIKDKGVLTWKTPTTLTVDRDTPKIENQSLVINEDYEYLASNESIGVSSESGVELFFEDWFKPELATISLLSTYNYVQSFNEVNPLIDKTLKFNWTSNKSFNTSDFVLNNTDYLEASAQPFLIKNPTTNEKGTTIEFTCKLVGTDRIYLLSNNSPAFSSSLGESLALVWFGNNATTNKNKIALVSDKTSIADVNNVVLMSNLEYVTGSELHIALVSFEGYYRLFVNGVLQGVKTISMDLNFGFGTKTFIGKCPWYTYVSPHTLTIYDFRFTNVALYTSAFNPPVKYKQRVIPNIPKVTDTVSSFKTGITCGVRYNREDGDVYVFAAVTDTYGETFTVKSSTVDCSKWNYIQLANTGSELTLFLNGVANHSLKLPYNIRFKEILLSGRDSNNFKGKMDNFRIYSKVKDTSPYLRSSELFSVINEEDNNALLDSNPLITWKPVYTTAVGSDVTAIRGKSILASTGGIYTNNVDKILNKYYFKLKLGIIANNYSGNNTEALGYTVVAANNSRIVPIVFSTNTSLILNFKIEEGVGTIITTEAFTITTEAYGLSSVKLTVEVAGQSFLVETPIRYGDNCEFILLKINGTLCVYIQDILQIKVQSNTSLNLSNVSITNDFIGSVNTISTYSFEVTKKPLINNVDGTNGLAISVYEIAKDIFILEGTYNEVSYHQSILTFKNGYNLIEFKQEGNIFNYIINNFEAGAITTEPFVKGSDKLTIMNNETLNKNLPFKLSYFSAESSQQDAILGLPYDVVTLQNESIYEGVVLNLSSDSVYNTPIVDRSANPVSKNVLNFGVSKAIKESGLYFDGFSYLKIKEDDDLIFGEKDFYIEFEINPTNLLTEKVILDRYVNGIGSWQVTIQENGYLNFIITNSETQPYSQRIIVPTAIKINKYTKIQISRSGPVFKFFLNDIFEYEYSTGVVFNFDRVGIDLTIGQQRHVRNSIYDFKGYLNNLRIVKDFSLDSDFNNTFQLETVPYSDYTFYLSDAKVNELLNYDIVIAFGSDELEVTNSGLALGDGSGYGDKDINSLVSTDNTKTGNVLLDVGDLDFRLNLDLKVNTKATSGNSIPILQLGSNADGIDGFGLVLYTAGSGLTYLHLKTSTSNVISVECSVNNWHNVSIIKDSNQLYLSLNGIRNSTSLLATDIVGSKNLTIGSFNGTWLNNGVKYYDNIRFIRGDSSLNTYGSFSGSSLNINTDEIVENFTTYSSNSNTMFQIHANSGVIKETKELPILVSNTTVVDVLGTNFKKAMLFNATSNIKTVSPLVDTSFTINSEATIEVIFSTTAFDSTQLLIKSINETLNNSHWELKLKEDLTGIIFSINKGSNVFQEFTLDKIIHPNKWYKLAITINKGVVIMHLNDDMYTFTEAINIWQANSITSSTVVGDNFRGLIEVIRISNKVVYTKSKNIRNIRRDSYLDLSRKLIKDDGNKPSDWITTGIISTTDTIRDSISKLRFLNVTDELERVIKLSPDKSAFTLTSKIAFDNLTEVSFEILSISFEDDLVLRLYKEETEILLVLTAEDQEVIKLTLPASLLVSDYNLFKITRDFSGTLEFQVNTLIASSQNIGNNLSEGTLSFKGFIGDIYLIEYFSKDTADLIVTDNILKLDFEKESIMSDYVVARNEGLVLKNKNVLEVKGLSPTSDSSAAFNGETSSLFINKFTALNFGLEPFDIAFNMYPTTGINMYQPIIGSNVDTFDLNNDATFIMLYGSTNPPHVLNGANKLAIGTSNGIAFENNPFLLSNVGITFNAWTSVRLTRVGNIFSLYINNALDKVVTYTGSFNLATNGCYFGTTGWHKNDVTSHYAGYLDDFKISQRGSYTESTNLILNEGLISGLDFEDVGVSYEIIQSEYKPDHVDSYTNTWSWGRYSTNSVYPFHQTVSAVNEALYFPGESYMFMYNKHFGPGLDQFSLSLDFMQTTSRNCYIFCIDTMYHLRVSNGILYFRLDGIDYNLGAALLNTWYTFAASRDSFNTLRFFINGKVKESYPNYLNNIQQGNSFYPVVLGRRWDYRDHPSYQGENLIGFIDNFYYERGFCKYTSNYVVFTDKTLKNTYNSLMYFDTVGAKDKNTNLTWSSSGITSIKTMNEFNANVGRCTTTSGYLQSSAHGMSLGYQDFTLEFYFRTSQITSESCLVDLAVSNSLQNGIRIIQPASSAASITVQIGSSGVSEWNLVMNTGINSIDANKTYHLRITRNIGTIYLFLDGVLKATGNYMSYIDINTIFTLFNTLGKNKGFNGVIEQFRFKLGQSFSAEASFPKLTGDFR